MLSRVSARPGRCRKNSSNSEFLVRERNLDAAFRESVRDGVELAFTKLEDRRVSGAMAAEQRLYARHEFAHAESFGEVIVRADVEAAHDVLLPAFRGEHEDRCLEVLGADGAADFVAVDLRQPDRGRFAVPWDEDAMALMRPKVGAVEGPVRSVGAASGVLQGGMRASHSVGGLRLRKGRGVFSVNPPSPTP